MQHQFLKFITEENLFTSGDRILLAISGGLDSTVMAELFHRAGYRFAIAHCNFHLRGAESDRDEEFVRHLALSYGVQLHLRHFDTTTYARKNKLSIQMAARRLRYGWFDVLLDKEGYAFVATAHHLDDQVETFLINLARGTGIAGLHGILPKQGNIIRPLMFTGRKEIEAYAKDNHLEFVEDSSNSSIKYTRNRVRYKILPHLDMLNPSFRSTLNETISYIRDAESILLKAVEEKRKAITEVNGEVISIYTNDFFSLEPLSAWAFELLSPYGFNRSNLRDIINLGDAISGKEILSPTHRLIKDRDRLIIIPRSETSGTECYPVSAADLRHGISSPLTLSSEMTGKYPGKFDESGNTAYLDPDKLHFPLMIRKWKKGDYFFPLGMTEKKKLSDFFIDSKFSRPEKESQWLLCSGNDIVWIIGKRIDERFKIKKDTIKVLMIKLID
jgi:tRNA(Ile)-lysidine synthase